MTRFVQLSRGLGSLLFLLGGLTFCRRPETSASTETNSTKSPGLPAVDASLLRVEPQIFVDQFGYLPQMQKVAVLADPQIGWNKGITFDPGPELEVRDAKSGAVAWRGAPVPYQRFEVDATSGDRGYWFDFTNVDTPGTYILYDPKSERRSVEFEIRADVYAGVLAAATRVFYFNRANVEKTRPFACVGKRCWTQGADHVGPNQDKEARSVRDRGNPKTARDLSGGWWDAGDTGKYVTFAYSPLHQLLTAYVENPAAFSDLTNIPESKNGVPDLLDEIRVELEFLKKMQAAELNGGVLPKVGPVDYGEDVPERSVHARFYYPASCSSAVISLASVFAHAALVFSGVERLKNQTVDLKTRAERAFLHYQGHPKQEDCDDGTIRAGDSDLSRAEQDARAISAAIYLFALEPTAPQATAQYLPYIEANYRNTRPFQEDRWSVYDAPVGDALLFFSRLPAAPEALKKTLQQAKRTQAQATEFYFKSQNLDLYRAYMRPDSYHWGSNQARANYGNTIWDLIEFGLVEPSERVITYDRVSGLLHWFHGVNPLGLVYLTNMADYGAERSLTKIYHTWFRDGDKKWGQTTRFAPGPAPGYVPGGPNVAYCTGDPSHRCANSEFQKQPPQKAYMDFNTGFEPMAQYDLAWELSEPAIYYQAAYIKLLSKFVDNPRLRK